MSRGEPIFQLNDLDKKYLDGTGHTLEILKQVNFRFQENQTVSIVGASGSGKSTLLNLLGGLDHPTSGEILFKGKDIYQQGSNALSEWRNRSVGFIFQSHHLLPDFTALENILIPSMIAEIPRQQSLAQAQALLDQVGLTDRASHKPSQLSGGEQQRIAIARALINQPEVILADEPTGNLDNKTSDRVSQMLLDICQKHGATLIMVTHNTELASRMEVKLTLYDGGLTTDEA